MTRYDTKNTTFDFFSGFKTSKNNDEEKSISDIFSDMVNEPELPCVRLGSFEYQVKGLRSSGNGFHGALCKFRTTDLPLAGKPGGVERELDLDDDEGLIEKNHFLFQNENNLLVFQRNGHAARVNRLSEYLTSYFGETIVFNPVIQPDAIERLMDEELEPVSLDLSYTPPKNRDFFPDDDWGKRLALLAADGNGARIKVSLSADRRSADTAKHHLWQGIKKSAAAIAGTNNASVARVKVTDGNVEYPIDLIADRLVANEEVEMIGRYPSRESIYSSLRRALESKRDELNEIFG